MRTYKYRAQNKVGRIVEGTIRAADSDGACRLLENEGLTPVNVDLAAEKKVWRTGGFFSIRVKDEDIIVFTRQLSTILKSGMPVLQALHVLRTQTANATLKQVLEDIGNSIAGGSRLSEAFAEFPKIFSFQYVSIVVSGEKGGGLVEALLSMADWMEHELEIKTQIKSALRYPVMVVVALIIAATLMLIFVVPRFAGFFARSTVQLPLPTRILIGANQVVQHYWPAALGAIIVSGVAIFFLLRMPLIRFNFDRLKFRLPIMGPVYGKIMISRFTRVFSMLVRNGVPVIKALEIAPAVVANTYLTESAKEARQTIQAGSSIFEGFDQSPVFPPIMTSLIGIGEKTGTLSEMLDLVVTQYDMDIRYTLKNLTTMIEPVITVVVAVGVLFLALAVFLPIWNFSRVLTQ